MPRKRKDDIVETSEQLIALEKTYHGKPEAARLRVLRLLKENPDLSIDDGAALVGYSKQAVKRWLKTYREQGVAGILGLRATGRAVMQGGDAMAILKSKIGNGDFSSLADVARWIDRRMEAVVVSSGATGESLPKAVSGTHANGGEVIDFSRLMSFLQSLPSTVDVQVWMRAVRESLLTMLPGVDRVSLTVNAQCDLTGSALPPRYSTIVSQRIETGTKAVKSVETPSENDGNAHIGRILDQHRSQGFPVDQYHPPHCFLYHLSGDRYLGTLIVWRDRSRSSLNQKVLDFVESLHGFMVFLFTDFVARYRYSKPFHPDYSYALNNLMDSARLTSQEKRIVIMLSLGLSYEEMAQTLNISVNTVRYHLRSLYDKAGVRSQSELVAKYFTPRYDPH